MTKNSGAKELSVQVNSQAVEIGVIKERMNSIESTQKTITDSQDTIKKTLTDNHIEVVKAISKQNTKMGIILFIGLALWGIGSISMIKYIMSSIPTEQKTTVKR